MHGLIIIIFILTIGIKPALAQIIEQKQVFVDKTRKKLMIPYSIQESNNIKYEYDIKLFYSQDAGKSYVGPLKYIEGHVGEEVLAGPDKVIVWDYLKENPNFFGNNVRFKIWATYKPSALNLGGPENALLSAVLPGWGDGKVTTMKHKLNWLYYSAPAGALLGSSIWMKIRSNKNYDRFLGSEDITEANSYFKKSDTQNKAALTLAFLGLSYWVYDVIKVGIKGLNNRKKIKRLEEKNKKLDINFGLNYDTELRNSELGLQFKF